VKSGALRDTRRGTRIGVASSALLAVLCAPDLARAAGPDPDPWFGRDKALHFGASATIAGSGYAIGAPLFDCRGHALILGGSLAAAAGITKELLDATGLGDPSWRDLAWDGIGTAAGLAFAWGIDLLVQGVSDEHPLLVAPRVDRDGAGLSLFVRF
jgi:putative lipoprotein